MGSRQAPEEYPAASDEMTAALNAALDEGDLHRITGTLREIALAHLRRQAEGSGASPTAFNQAPGTGNTRKQRL